MSIIGETILAVSLEMLFKKLATKGLQLFARQEQIQADLKNWERMLVKIKAVLDDADEKQTRESSVRIWLEELQNLAYDIEDILDEFATEALRRELLNEPDQQPNTSISKLHKLIPTCCAKFSPGSVKFVSMMASKVAKITGRLQEITTQKDQLELKENSGGRSKRARKQPETTSLVIEAEVHGREDERKAIVDLLLKDDSSSDGGLSVIPIIGMGGLGKTTLAQFVYNDKMVESHFDLKAWACVSEDFDAVRVTRTILNAISQQTASGDDLNSLQVKLKKELSVKKFLLVLDDMWNESYCDWTNLRLPFVAGAAGSKIIVTTRNQGVASIMGTVPAYELKKLSVDDCLLVFTQHSLGTKDFNKHQHLKEIGKEIVKKCNGLPLAAKTLGGLLRGKYDPRDWKKVLINKIWDLPEEGSDIMRALRVSYYYLPAHLKRCFSHCALLPKDYEFGEKEIVLLWMAEGLLHSNMSGEEMEESGHNYFQQLQSRSFFQQSRTDSSLFVMHDLINDLAQWAAGKIYFRMEGTLDGSKQQEFYKTLRHFSYIRGNYDSIQRFGAIADAKNLRTFLPVSLEKFPGSYLSYNVAHLLLKLQRLRVLSLRGYEIYEIPNSIGDLKYLRHLDLSETSIETLPESINMLYNLHTLLLEGCFRLRKLCADMGNLKKLCHLDNSGASNLEEMPIRIGKLACLKTLCHFAIGENSGSGLQELKSLKNLQGELMISRLENVKVAGDAIEADLNGKQKLNVLVLRWTYSNGNSMEAGTDTQVLDMLRPHENLEELTISGYGGTKFPIWLINGALANLVLLRFERCCTCTSLASVGQLPVLKHLFLIQMDGVKSVDQDFYGNNGSVAFPLLETLSFEWMSQWEDWIPHGSGQEVLVFPQLRELSLVGCPMLLGSLPERLPSLESLVIRNCKQLVVSVPFTQTLCKFEIRGCKKVMQRSAIDLSLLNSSLVSNDLINQVFLTGELEQDQLPNIEELVIHNSEKLTYLWKNGSRLLQDISFLHRFEIEHFPQLVSLVEEEDEEDYQKQQGLLCKLQCLKLGYCQSLVKLPQALLSLCSLKEIKISECQSLESLPQALLQNNGNAPLESLSIDSCHSLTYIARVPPRLKRLEVADCRNLTTLIDESEDINNDSSRYTSLLVELDVEDCPSLISLWSKSEIPATMESIDVYNCSKLACLSSRGNLPKALKTLHIHALSEMESIAQAGCDELTVLVIGSCDKLTELAIDGCGKLTELEIVECGKLKTITNFTHHPTSLRVLEIRDCPNIEGFRFGFATNIVELSIDYERIYKPMLELGGFHIFTSIRNLSLFGGECCDVLSLPPEANDAQGMALPTSLNILMIFDFPNLECISSTIGEHTSLESLRFDNCPKLQHFPENGLPISLLNLYITRCPLIRERCMKDIGQYWPLIAHIPVVYLDHTSAFRPRSFWHHST